MANGDISWRCTVIQCTLTIQTNSKISNLLTENENIFHGHNIVENRDIQRQIVRNNCKRKVNECISERLNTIFRHELMAVENTELLYGISSIRKSTYRQRQKIISAAPILINELVQQIKINSLTTHRNETFCHVDEELKIVIHTSKSNLEYLVNNSYTILGGGQAWYRQIEKLRLKIEYDKNESEISTWLKYFFGLSFLHSIDISDTFYELFSIASNNNKISAVFDCILANVIENDSIYPPHL
ncbi:Hypothetical protein CINCED_3A013458 [Cinara cedri]|uniref:Uncharacterized protein n=1 Tax=Cinara cedri TaxID=506608 RepID=A0A5E4M219_9HEMI|nr:Hypothetical protein CINCED_3A013458 [Cinara cedri]